MKTPFVRYDVLMEKNVGDDEEPIWVPLRATGIVRDTPHKLGAIFQQNNKLLHCSRVVTEEYYPIFV